MRQTVRGADNGPEIAVVVPTYQRASLQHCIEALAAQTLAPERFEVIISDDGSRVPVTEAHSAILSAVGDRLRIRVVRQPNSGPGVARNLGAAVATARYLAFTDDDCRPAPDWLERLLNAFRSYPDALLGGGMRTSEQADQYARATQAIMDFVYDHQQRRGGLQLYSTSNLALSAEAFRSLQGFSPLFGGAGGEDYDLCARWHQAGGSFRYVPDAMIDHHHALTLRRYVRQHFNYGSGLLLMRQRNRPNATSSALPVTRGIPGAFYLQLIASPLRTQGMRGTAMAALIGLSQLATAAGALSNLTRRPHSGGKPTRERPPT